MPPKEDEEIVKGTHHFISFASINFTNLFIDYALVLMKKVFVLTNNNYKKIT